MKGADAEKLEVGRGTTAESAQEFSLEAAPRLAGKAAPARVCSCAMALAHVNYRICKQLCKSAAKSWSLPGPSPSSWFLSPAKLPVLPVDSEWLRKSSGLVRQIVSVWRTRMALRP